MQVKIHFVFCLQLSTQVQNVSQMPSPFNVWYICLQFITSTSHHLWLKILTHIWCFCGLNNGRLFHGLKVSHLNSPVNLFCQNLFLYCLQLKTQFQLISVTKPFFPAPLWGNLYVRIGLPINLCWQLVKHTITKVFHRSSKHVKCKFMLQFRQRNCVFFFSCSVGGTENFYISLFSVVCSLVW